MTSMSLKFCSRREANNCEGLECLIYIFYLAINLYTAIDCSLLCGWLMLRGEFQGFCEFYSILDHKIFTYFALLIQKKL